MNAPEAFLPSWGVPSPLPWDPAEAWGKSAHFELALDPYVMHPSSFSEQLGIPKYAYTTISDLQRCFPSRSSLGTSFSSTEELRFGQAQPSPSYLYQ